MAKILKGHFQNKNLMNQIMVYIFYTFRWNIVKEILLKLSLKKIHTKKQKNKNGEFLPRSLKLCITYIAKN